MKEPERLERITLGHQAISFNRLQGSGASYYHWHQCVEFLYVSKGYGIVVMDNQHYTLRPGRLFIFPPFRLHKVQVDESATNRYHRTTMHFEHTLIESHLQPFTRFQAQFTQRAASHVPAQAYDLQEHEDFMETVLARFQAQGPDYPAEEIAFLVMQMLSLVSDRPLVITPQQPTVSAQIMQWVETHYAQKFSLDELAQAIGLSRSYTSRIFRQQTGGTLHEYLLTRRLKRGCDLLRNTSLSVDEISSRIGFSETTYFITCFKKMMRQTPLQYRKLARQSASPL